MNALSALVFNFSVNHPLHPAGLSIYRAALADPSVTQVTLLTRRAIPSWAVLPPNADEKTRVILHEDFKTYPPELAKGLAEHDALIWALGKSSLGMSEAQYTEITYTYTMNAATALKDAGAGTPERPFRFIFLSGSLADPKGESRQMWANVKVRCPCPVRHHNSVVLSTGARIRTLQ